MITAKYLGRLGLLTIVNEEENKENKTMELSSPVSVGDEIIMTPPDSGKSSVLEDSGERGSERASEFIIEKEKLDKFNVTKYIEGELEKLLKVKKLYYFEKNSFKGYKKQKLTRNQPDFN